MWLRLEGRLKKCYINSIHPCMHVCAHIPPPPPQQLDQADELRRHSSFWIDFFHAERDQASWWRTASIMRTPTGDWGQTHQVPESAEKHHTGHWKSVSVFARFVTVTLTCTSCSVCLPVLTVFVPANRYRHIYNTDFKADTAHVTCVPTYSCTLWHRHAQTEAHRHTHTHSHTHTCMHTHIVTHTHTHSHADMHEKPKEHQIYINKEPCTHMHACKPPPPPPHTHTRACMHTKLSYSWVTLRVCLPLCRKISRYHNLKKEEECTGQ